MPLRWSCSRSARDTERSRADLQLSARELSVPAASDSAIYVDVMTVCVCVSASVCESSSG